MRHMPKEPTPQSRLVFELKAGAKLYRWKCIRDELLEQRRCPRPTFFPPYESCSLEERIGNLYQEETRYE